MALILATMTILTRMDRNFKYLVNNVGLGGLVLQGLIVFIPLGAERADYPAGFARLGALLTPARDVMSAVSAEFVVRATGLKAQSSQTPISS